jgi:hypothetical protein
MPNPPLDPDVADEAPQGDVLTPYDEEHLMTYLRLLDGRGSGSKWPLLCCTLIPRESPNGRAWESHLARAKWMTEHGYRHPSSPRGSSLRSGACQ